MVCFTNGPEFQEYLPLVEAFLAAMGTPSELQDPEDVAEVIWTAVTDGTTRLRHIAGGGGADGLLGQHCSAEQDEPS